MADIDFIGQEIENSWYKYNPQLTAVCLHVIEQLKKYPFQEKAQNNGFNKCWLFMQILHAVNFEIPIRLPYYWYKDGVVVDPEALMLLTGGRIRFKWEEDCAGCQIEYECPCVGNPHNNHFSEVEEKLIELRRR